MLFVGERRILLGGIIVAGGGDKGSTRFSGTIYKIEVTPVHFGL